MDNELQRQILIRLNTLIALQLDRDAANDDTSISSRIQRLEACGLASREIADILNKPLNYVTAATSTRKRRAGKAAGAKNGER
jgi:hypothetical protein